MFRFDPLHPVSGAIIEVLANNPGIAAPEIRKRLESEKKISVSRASLYRVLKQLQEAKVLSHRSLQYSLNGVWLSGLLGFAESAKKTHLTGGNSEVSLPEKEGDQKVFTAGSLYDLEQDSLRILVQLAAKTSMVEWYQYGSHPAFTVGMTDKVQRNKQAAKLKGVFCYALFGNDTPLDKYVFSLLQSADNMEVAVSDKTSFPREGCTIFVCGPYVVRCDMPQVIADHVAFVFQNAESLSEFDPSVLANIFRMKIPASFVVRKDTKMAEKFKKEIMSHFPKKTAA